MLTAIVIWRLGIILGLQASDRDFLMLLGLPLVGFFILGIVSLTAVAWSVGVLPVKLVRNAGTNLRKDYESATLVGARP